MTETLESGDEFLHDWPADCDTTWKENYYWNMADREAGVWGFCHASFERTRGRAVFAAIFHIDGRVRFYRNEIEGVGDRPELGDGIVQATIVSPFAQHHIVVDAAEYRLDLDYSARFPAFSYSGRKLAANRQSIPHLRLKRYEQGMRVKGTCLLKDDGRSLVIDCLGHRDHSWGRREESKIDGWNWAAVQMESKTINLTRSFTGDAFNVNGFVSTPAGNLGVTEVEFETLEWEADGRTPLSTRYTFSDENGAVWHLRSRRFSDLFAPLKTLRASQSTVIYENFADYVLEETGETGWGIDEYQRHYPAVSP